MARPGKPAAMQKPQNMKKSLLFLLSYIKTQKFRVIAAATMMLINIFTSLEATNRLQPIIDNFLQPITGNPTVSERLAGLLSGIIGIGIFYLISVTTSYLQSKLMLDATQKIINTLRKDLFAHLQALPVRYYDSHTHGELMSRFTNDVDTLNDALSNSLITLFSCTLTIIGIIVLMFTKSVFLSILTLALTPLMFFIAQKIMKRSSKYFIEQQRNLGRVNGYIEEIMTGQKVVKVFCHEENVKKEFEKLNDELRISATKAQTYAGIMIPIMMNANNTIYSLVAMIGGLLSISGNLSVGALIVFLNLVKQFGRPINEASSQFNAVITALAGVERIADVMNQSPEQDDYLYS